MSFTPMSAEQLSREVERVPIFPLPGLVFMPASLLPLHVFEPRYRELVQDALAGNGLLVVPRLREGWEQDYQGAPPVYGTAGVGQIVRHQALPDGRHNVILIGLGRVDILAELPPTRRYREVRARLRPDLRPPAGQLERLLVELQAMAASLMSPQPELAGALARVAEGRNDPVRYVDTVAHLVLTQAAERQAYLELDAVADRAALVQTALATRMAGSASVEA